MIAGFVRAMRSRRVVVASARTGRHARTASATVAHHSAVATAGCAPSGHGENPVSGLSAPTTICAMNSEPVSAAATPRPGISRRRDHAPATAPATITPTAAAM